MQYVLIASSHMYYTAAGTQRLYAFAMFSERATNIEGVALYLKAHPNFEKDAIDTFTLQEWHDILDSAELQDDKLLLNW